MSTYGERLRKARMHAGLSQAELARRARSEGATRPSPQTVQYLEDPEKRADGSQYTASLAFACGIDALWLESGRGQMLRADAAKRHEAAAQDLAAAIAELRPEISAPLSQLVGALRGPIRAPAAGSQLTTQKNPRQKINVGIRTIRRSA